MLTARNILRRWADPNLRKGRKEIQALKQELEYLCTLFEQHGHFAERDDHRRVITVCLKPEPECGAVRFRLYLREDSPVLSWSVVSVGTVTERHTEPIEIPLTYSTGSGWGGWDGGDLVNRLVGIVHAVSIRNPTEEDMRALGISHETLLCLYANSTEVVPCLVCGGSGPRHAEPCGTAASSVRCC